MSRKLADLTLPAREKALRLIAAAPLVLGRELFVVHTYRSAEEQDELYAQGRTKPGSIVTNAKGGESDHQDRTAIDFAFEEDGSQRPTWSTAGTDAQDWQLLGAMGKAIGFKWGGDYRRLKDLGHFTLPKS